MSDREELVPFAVKSYRYLRLAIVVLVLSLMASVLIERFQVSCWQESISAYYYTPVHAIFVGALVAIGVSLIAIKGSTDVEDMLLNVAGVLAPIVAFVPTSTPSPNCSSTAFAGVDAKAYIDNNVLAFAIGGGIAIAIAYVVARVMGKARIRKVDPPSVVGLVFSVAAPTLKSAGFGAAPAGAAQASTATSGTSARTTLIPSERARPRPSCALVGRRNEPRGSR